MNSRTCAAATSIAAAEGLKDQGFTKWGYAIRSIQQHANKNFIRSYSQANKIVSTSTSSVIANKLIRDDKLNQCEDSLKNVMYLNCWGAS